jgi:hypothetical protein
MKHDLTARRSLLIAAIAISVGSISSTPSSGQAPPDGKGPPPPGNDGQRPPPKKDGQGPLAAAAKELGISEKTLAEAVGPAPPNIERGAKMLGIPQAKLEAAMQKYRPKL